jgi:23S rRNA (pseudouridine1915-N3)-methyltransferase
MPIRIIAIGKKHEAWIAAGIERYEKRLKRPYDLKWVFLAHSAQEGMSARHEESKRLLASLPTEDFVILLDEKGKLLDSPIMSKILLVPLESSKNVTIVIGGAYGVDETIHTRADFVWSLSPLVFPHQLVRLILIEQLYRFQAVTNNHPYHHD